MNKNLKIIIPAAIAAVVVVILLLFFLLGGGYKKPIKTYFNALSEKDADTYYDAFPEFIAKKDKKKYDDYKETKEKALKNKEDYLEETYGKGLEVSYEIIDEIEQSDEDDLDDIVSYIKAAYDKKVEVTGCYQVALKITYEGKKSKKETYATVNVYKIEGKWCILDDIA